MKKYFFSGRTQNQYGPDDIFCGIWPSLSGPTEAFIEIMETKKKEFKVHNLVLTAFSLIEGVTE